ncbi:MAG: hypothetical protein ABIP71_06945 [Verrucomicrobiota bacterium]
MNTKPFAPFSWKVLVLLSICWLSVGRAQTNYENYTFTRFAGPMETPGWHDGSGSAARFSGPHKIAVDQIGNVFVADYVNNTIRKITSSGAVTTVAGLAGITGSADGSGRTARFNNPAAIVVDSGGNLYVADYGNHTIRKITPAGLVTTLAGKAGSLGSANGTGSAARFNFPIGLTLDGASNLYVADSRNHTVRKISPTGTVTTLVGTAGSFGSVDGTGSTARFYYPFGITADESANLFVTDLGNSTIRKITSGGVVTTLAGSAGNTGSTNGTGESARFNQPFDIVINGQGNFLVADTYNHLIRQVTPAGEVTTIAGMSGSSGSNDGTGDAARFYFPTGVGIDGSGNIYVADYSNNTIRKVAAGGSVTTLAGTSGGVGSTDGSASVARFNFPAGVAVQGDGNIFVADLANHTVRKITAEGVVSTLAGLVGTAGSTNGTGNAALFNNPLGVALDTNGSVFVTDYGNHTIRKITSSGVVSTLAGSPGVTGSADGNGSAARFFSPFFLTVGNDGNLFVTDTWNHTIRKITPGGAVTTVAGTAGSSGSANGTGAAARFSYPKGIAADTAGNLFVADNDNHTIRKMTPSGEVTTFAGLAGTSGSLDGTGAATRFNSPFGLTIDPLGNLYVADYGSSTVRKITPGRVVTTLAGIPNTRGNEDGAGNAVLFSGLEALAVDAAGHLYVSDSGNHSIRKGSPALPDRPVVDLPTGTVGTMRQLSVSNLTTTSSSWRIIRRPAASSAQLSATNITNPTFTPDVPDLFILRFEGRDDLGRMAIGNVSIMAGPGDVLSLAISGQGAVTPNYNNAKLVIGKIYTLTARPITGYIFAGWTGGVESSNAKLTFTMRDNLVIEANFIPNPFPAVAGVYQGLFFEEDKITHQSSGFLNAKVTAKGAFSAKIQLAGKSYALSGPLSATGAFQKTINRTGLPPLSTQIQVDLNGADIATGQISDGNWSADLTADRNIYSKINPASTGKYTLAVLGNRNLPELPGGNGFGTVTSDALGNVKFAGSLGDGTKISQKAIRSKQSHWPFYVSLYSGNGSILSQLTFTNNSITNVDGSVSWIKLLQPKSKVYPAGFTNEVNVTGSTYHPTNGVPLLNFTDGQLEFTGGNLGADFTNFFVFGAADKVTNSSSNKLSLSLTRNSGLFKGSVVNPATSKSMSFSGALLQNQAVGYGVFTGTNQTGGVFFRAAQ